VQWSCSPVRACADVLCTDLSFDKCLPFELKGSPRASKQVDHRTIRSLLDLDAWGLGEDSHWQSGWYGDLSVLGGIYMENPNYRPCRVPEDAQLMLSPVDPR